MASHDVMQHVFASIVRDARFHILCEPTHILPPHTFWSMHQWVNIMVLVNDV
jgi:hypothetical protein